MKFITFFISFLVLFFSTTSLAQTSFGNAIDFDGYGDYANTLNDPYFLTPDGTLEAWVKVRSITAQIGNVFFEKNEEQWNKGDFYIFFETASGKIKARIQSFPSKPPMQADIISDMSFWNSYNIWAHVAFTWGSDGMSMFINGNLQINHNSIRNSALNNNYNFYVGADGYMQHNGNYIVSNFFDGQIDEVRIWNHQRTGEQITSLWDAPLDSSYFASSDSGLVGYWRFDELEDLGVNNDGVDDVRDLSVLHSHLDLAGDAHLVPSYIIIPVELVSFTIDVDGNLVNLSWITATETNNFGFEVERKSVDEWETIGFVEGNGSTTEMQHYSFSDNIGELKLTDKISYRLKQLDLDGTYEYSKEVEVIIELPTDYILNQNYPNPFNPTTHIKFYLPEASHTSLIVFDNLGCQVSELLNEQKPAGSYEIEFDAKHLSSGIYFYKLRSGKFVKMKKMILLK